MQQYLREQVDWPQPFAPAEYAARRARVRRALAAKDIAAIYVTTPANLTWLTGYDMIWYHARNLTGLLLRADRDETVFFDYPTHSTILATTPEIGAVVWLDYAPPAATIEITAKTLAAKGLGTRVAVEPGMVFNFENQFDVSENWPGGSGAAWIDSLLVTEDGLEPLSKLPRALVTV